jgi:GNAT superfamily N-acetyltransferase
MLVRPRTDDDLDALQRVAEAVQEVDGYPPYLPGELRDFVTNHAIAAWVVEVDGDVAGHVALHRHSSGPVMALAAEATGRPAEDLGVVARLLVHPDVRRRGAGRALLGAAAGGAGERGWWPVLDVGVRFAGAIALYERCGWTRAGRVTVTFSDFTFEEFVYVAPVG